MLKQLDNLVPRWRLQTHPLFPLALQRLGLSSSLSVNRQLTTVRHEANTLFDAYQQIVVPAEGSMYRHLMQRAKEVVSAGTKTVVAFKRIMMGLNNLLAAENGTDAVQSGPGVLAPISKKKDRRRGRPSNADILNRSALKRAREQNSGKIKSSVSGRACKTCRQNGVIATGHRTGNKCPFAEQAQKSARHVQLVPGDNNDMEHDCE